MGGLAALAALCALVAARSDVGLPGCATFTYPMLQKANGITVPLDHCLNTTKECGEVVAHNFCQLHNYNTAVAFNDTVRFDATMTLDGKECQLERCNGEPGRTSCGGYLYIVCC